MCRYIITLCYQRIAFIIICIHYLEPEVIESRTPYSSSVIKDIRNHQYDNIIISPGPGSPYKMYDIGKDMLSVQLKIPKAVYL